MQSPSAPLESNTPADDHRQRIKHSSQQAEKYCQRNNKKHSAEMALINRAINSLHLHHHADHTPLSILDAPCGVGRATIFLAQQGYAATGIDLGEGAINAARRLVNLAAVKATIDKGDLLYTPYPNQYFDVVLCFRFFHHLPTPSHRQQIINELCRVSHSHILISYLSPWSTTSLKRRLKRLMTGKKSVQHQTSLSELTHYFSNQGFELINDFAQLPLLHSLHLAVFRRIKQ